MVLYIRLLRITVWCCLLTFASTALSSSLTKTWSNRLGTTLTPVTNGVWAADRPFIWNGIDVGGRSIIARMKDGSLVVHSPVEFTDNLRVAMERLGGKVNHIISPNYEHVKYIKNWQEVYPNAYVYGCPGLPRRIEDVRFSYEFGTTDTSDFSETIDWVWMNCEENPFTGKPFFNEVVFYHKPSRTMFCADAFWNYPTSCKPNYYGIENTGEVHRCSKVSEAYDYFYSDVEVPMGTKMWAFGMNKVYLPFYKKLMIQKYKVEYLKVVDKILSWDLEVIAPCHGDLIKGSGICKKVLKEHFAL